ncbi:MAG TPA: hypothetical protein PLG47_01385 [Candidatus Dojkabacteria bacterium]|nr:hypothetical protein [Candidatus Dojkabacteria bacterium]HPQ79088.1 hypothetical protein [Candidatus Dojkabacteria bacterium]
MDFDKIKPDARRLISTSPMHYIDWNRDYIAEVWEAIIKANSSSPTNETIQLHALLDEYHITSLMGDFLCMAYKFQGTQSRARKYKEREQAHEDYDLEHLKAIRFLLDNRIEDIILDFRHKLYSKPLTLNNAELIAFIKEAMLNNFFALQHELPSKRGKEYWSKVIEQKISELEKAKSKAGRKRKYHFLGSHIYTLRRYLQDNTDLKTREGILISRRQSLFIFKYLSIYGMIGEDITSKEDLIYHILEDYQKGFDM